MRRMIQVWIVTCIGLLIVGSSEITAADKPARHAFGIPPETVADYLHALIAADRTFYTIHVVERLQNRGVVSATERWRAENTLPLPAQFVMESSELAAKTGTAVRYHLSSLWPINPQNRPATDFERTGLEDVLRHPERPHRGIVTLGADRYFQAVYADRAVSQACVTCHNADPRSPKRDYKMDDVMGAVVISIPLGK